jgi:hypothetical protein
VVPTAYGLSRFTLKKCITFTDSFSECCSSTLRSSVDTVVRHVGLWIVSRGGAYPTCIPANQLIQLEISRRLGDDVP